MTNSSSQMPKKRRPPLSIRLNEKEHSALISQAGPLPLSTYIKSVVFDDQAKRYRQAPKIIHGDRKELAKLLAWLGQTQIAAHLAILANAAESGSLDVNEPVTKAILKACSDIDYIRHALMHALGKQTPSSELSPPATKLKLKPEEFKLLSQSLEMPSENRP